MTQTTALAVSPNDKLRAIMRSPDVMERFAEVLGQHQASAYVTSVVLAVANNEQLQQCAPGSIVSSAMRAATLRLSCDPATKQAHLVPFKGKATLVVGYKGYYDMAQRTGKYRYLNDFKVYEGQQVIEDQLTGAVRIEGHRTSDTVIGYGFYFEMLNGLSKVLYMTVDEIRAHGERHSKTFSYNTSLWKTDFPAMARKTVIRLCLSRYGYLDPNDRLTLAVADETETEDGEYEDVEVTPAPRRSEAQSLRELGYTPPEADDPYSDYPDELIEDGDFVNAEEHEPVQQQAPTKPALRQPPETLKANLERRAKETAKFKVSGAQQGIIAAVMESALFSGDPKANRKQLLAWFFGKDSLAKLTNNELAALYSWLKPWQDSGGEWKPEAMAEREMIAAFAHCQPVQESLPLVQP